MSNYSKLPCRNSSTFSDALFRRAWMSFLFEAHTARRIHLHLLKVWATVLYLQIKVNISSFALIPQCCSQLEIPDAYGLKG